MALTRRELLEKCLATGALGMGATTAPALLLDAWATPAEPRPPTPSNDVGPFYKRRAPERAVLRVEGDPGLPLSVAGTVWSARGAALPGAVIELWQADHRGHYDIDGHRYRARIPVDGTGSYTVETVMPGHYPGRVCQHVHYLVTAPGHRPLVTQLYFATDPVFEGDPDRNLSRDPIVRSRELVRPVVLTGDPASVRAAVRFELVLETL
jgi:protocatechuate 3,4-dioxygenase beta subunit